MSRIVRSKADELQNRLTPFLQQSEYEDLAGDIRRELRRVRPDPETTARLRMLLGSTYFWAKKYPQERAQYRKVLEQEPGNIEAMIAMGSSFQQTKHYSKADGWFQAAYLRSHERQDYAGRLHALDMLAVNAELRGDDHLLLATLDRMCRLIASAPRLDCIHALIAEHLIVKEKSDMALPFQECFIKYALESGCSRFVLVTALRAWVGIRRQQGRSYEEISEELHRFRVMAVDDETAANFDIVTEWAFSHSRHVYEMIFRDLKTESER